MRKSLFILLALLCMPAMSWAAQFGTYHGNGCDGVKKAATFATWFGRQPDYMLDFFAADSWQSMLSDAKWAVGCWSDAKVKTVAFSVPMIVNGGYTFAEGAAGAYDDNFRQIAELLVANGYDNSVVRLGWEFNGGWYPWAASKDPANWVAYWRRIVTVMRAVPGAKFRFDWCSAQGYQQLPADQLYPGDEYVDIIGRDTYNQTWAANVVTPEQRWNDLLTEAYGLNWLRDFAKQHNKPISMPEWGTGTRPDGHGGGDDANFVLNMAAWMKQNQVVYHDYWDYPAQDYNAQISEGQQPAAAAAFVAAFRAIPLPPEPVAVK